MIKNKIIFGVLTLMLLCTPAYAGITLMQGDTVYHNETVDVTYVVGWEQTLAWWSSGSYDDTDPDLTFDTTDMKYGGQHNFYLNPDTFPIGWYYKWDGVYEKGSNPVAFYLSKGERKKTNATENVTPQTTIKTVDVNQSIINENLPELSNTTTDLFICRGYDFSYSFTSEKNLGRGYLWLFGTYDMIPQLKMDKTDTTYKINIQRSDTENKNAGSYTGLLQFEGDNHWQDIYYVKTPRNEELATPYKGIVNVSVNGIQPKMVFDYILKLRDEAVTKDSRYNDDVYIKKNVTLIDPMTTITEFLEYNNNAYVIGITTIPAGESVLLKLDEDKHPTPSDLAKHTWTVNTTGDYGNYRIFSAVIPIKWDEMALGMHEITAAPERFDDNKNVFMFNVTSQWTNPVVTPEQYKIIVDEYGVRRITIPPTTIAPTPTPEKIIVKETVIVYVTPETTVTTQPTPSQTPNDNMTIPLSEWIAVLAVVVVCVYTAIKER